MIIEVWFTYPHRVCIGGVLQQSHVILWHENYMLLHWKGDEYSGNQPGNVHFPSRLFISKRVFHRIQCSYFSYFCKSNLLVEQVRQRESRNRSGISIRAGCVSSQQVAFFPAYMNCANVSVNKDKRTKGSRSASIFILGLQLQSPLLCRSDTETTLEQLSKCSWNNKHPIGCPTSLNTQDPLKILPIICNHIHNWFPAI